MSGAVNAVLTVILLVGVGILVDRLGWVSDGVMSFINHFVVRLALPFMLLNNITSMFSRETMISFFPVFALNIAICVAAFYIAKALALLIKMDRKRIGAFSDLVATSNSVFIGLPVATMVYGSVESTEGMMAVFLAQTVVCWTLCWNELLKDGRKDDEGKGGLLLAVKACLTSVPILFVILGFVLVFLNIKIPFVIKNVLSYVGSTVTPLSMMFIGMFLSRSSIKALRPDRDTVIVLLMRHLFSPAFVLFAVFISLRLGLSVSTTTRNVMVVLVSSSAAAQVPLLCESAGSDTEFSSRVVTISTVLFLFTLPIMVALLN